MSCSCGEVACKCKDQCRCHPDTCCCFDCDHLRKLARRRDDGTEGPKFCCIVIPPTPTKDERNDPSSEGESTNALLQTDDTEGESTDALLQTDDTEGESTDALLQMDDTEGESTDALLQMHCYTDGVPQVSPPSERKGNAIVECFRSLCRCSKATRLLPPIQWTDNPKYESLENVPVVGLDTRSPQDTTRPTVVFEDHSRLPGEIYFVPASAFEEGRTASDSHLLEPVPEAGSSKGKSHAQYSSEESESVGMKTLTISDDSGSIDKQTLPESSSSVYILPESSESGSNSEPRSVTSATFSQSNSAMSTAVSPVQTAAKEPDSSEAPASNSGVTSSARPTSAESDSSIQALLDAEQSSEDSEPTDPSKEPEE